MGLFNRKSNHSSDDSSNPGGFVATRKSQDGADTVVVTTDGVRVHHCPGGLTEDELLD